MGERRQSTRKKSFLRGRIYFNNRRSAVDCLVRDISHEGAKLIFSDTIVVPDVVDLHIPQKEQTLRAHVQWRHGEEMGVAFESAAEFARAEPAADGTDLAARVGKLEDEMASMRRLLRKLKAVTPGIDDDAA